MLKFRKWLIIDLLKVGETCETFSHRTFYVYVTIPLNPLSRHFVLLAAKVHWTFDLSLATFYRPKGLKNKVLSHLRKLSSSSSMSIVTGFRLSLLQSVSCLWPSP